MSGVDEQRVPQCPKCNKSHEICVGRNTFMFPENARIKRGLKHMLYSSRHNIVEKTIPQFYERRISCALCGKFFDNDTEYYNRLKKLFDVCVARGEYYDNDTDFYEDDNEECWDSDGNFKMELNE